MNPYEYSELEARNLYCEICERLIFTKEYVDNDGLCDKCYNNKKLASMAQPDSASGFYPLDSGFESS